MCNEWEEVINEKYEPLEFGIEPSLGSDILVWRTSIGGVDIKCQSSGKFEEQTSEPYALYVWERKQFIPMLMFLKHHEEELEEYLERWK